MGRFAVGTMVVVGALVAVALIAGCGSSGPNEQAKAIDAASVEVAATISVTANGFDPTSLTMKAGQLLKFHNTDAHSHALKGKQGNETAFDAGRQGAGDVFTWKSSTPGTVTVTCDGAKLGTLTVTVTAAR